MLQLPAHPCKQPFKIYLHTGRLWVVVVKCSHPFDKTGGSLEAGKQSSREKSKELEVLIQSSGKTLNSETQNHQEQARYFK
jgi:hypothetical protein